MQNLPKTARQQELELENERHFKRERQEFEQADDGFRQTSNLFLK